MISFHSLEDRLVKQYFANQASPCVCPPRMPMCVCGRVATLELVSRHGVVADAAEVARNPRSRSARLRCAIKRADPLPSPPAWSGSRNTRDRVRRS